MYLWNHPGVQHSGIPISEDSLTGQPIRTHLQCTLTKWGPSWCYQTVGFQMIHVDHSIWQNDRAGRKPVQQVKSPLPSPRCYAHLKRSSRLQTRKVEERKQTDRQRRRGKNRKKRIPVRCMLLSHLSLSSSQICEKLELFFPFEKSQSELERVFRKFSRVGSPLLASETLILVFIFSNLGFLDV